MTKDPQADPVTWPSFAWLFVIAIAIAALARWIVG